LEDNPVSQAEPHCFIVKLMSRHRFGVSLYAMLLLFSGIAQAQNNLSLTGTVEDPLAAPVAGASVALISEERVLQTKSEANGSFVFRQITAGPYEVEITAPGFAKQRISLDLPDRTTLRPLSIVLHVGNQPDEELCGSHASIAYGPLGVANARLSGTVQDYVHGHVLQNAEVSLWKAGDPRAAFQSHSDESGRFTFENLPAAGHYALRITRLGYQPVDIKQLVKPQENELIIRATILRQNKMIACQ
jgi:hypothetical protein